MEKESSLGQRMKNYGNSWLTSTKTQVWTEEKTFWGRVLVVTAVNKLAKIIKKVSDTTLCFKLAVRTMLVLVLTQVILVQNKFKKHGPTF